jgi:hypothetical protein
MNQEFPTLQDIAPSWADIKTTVTPLGGSLIDTIDYSALNWGSTVEVGEQRGASGGRVMRTTTGQLTHEASATYYRSGLRKLVRGLIPLAPQRATQRMVSLVHFDIFIQHTPPGEVDIYEVKLKGCRLLGFTASMTEGTDADKIELALHAKEIVQIIDGLEVVLI